MSTQELDVKKAWRAIRRGHRTVAAVAALGLLAGIGLALLRPPLHNATSLVVLPPPPVNASQNTQGLQNIDTQVFIANSESVLKSAGQNLNPPLATDVVRDRVAVTAVTEDVIQFKARGTSARQAIMLANAVAEVYLVFVTTDQKLPGDLGKKTGARMLEEASNSTGGNMLVHLGIYGVLGTLIGLLAGAVIVLAIARGDRRLRLRDEISDAVGIPVLASVSSYRAKDISDWANLLENYHPSSVDAWSLRKTLHRLGLDAKGGPPVSLGVISFAGDDKALPLGPQLAAFATSIGIQTALLVDTPPEVAPAEITSGAALEAAGTPDAADPADPADPAETATAADTTDSADSADAADAADTTDAADDADATANAATEDESGRDAEDVKTSVAVPALAAPAPLPPPHRLLGQGAKFGDGPAKVALDIELIVVDRDKPQLTGALHTTTTIVALSAGTVTAEELARLAVAAAADDRTIDGLVVTDPDPTDRTIGRVSQSMRRSNSRLPTLLTGTTRRTT